jgi:hypothetical protein
MISPSINQDLLRISFGLEASKRIFRAKSEEYFKELSTQVLWHPIKKQAELTSATENLTQGTDNTKMSLLIFTAGLFCL